MPRSPRAAAPAALHRGARRPYPRGTGAGAARGPRGPCSLASRSSHPLRARPPESPTALRRGACRPYPRRARAGHGPHRPCSPASRRSLPLQPPRRAGAGRGPHGPCSPASSKRGATPPLPSRRWSRARPPCVPWERRDKIGERTDK